MKKTFTVYWIEDVEMVDTVEVDESFIQEIGLDTLTLEYYLLQCALDQGSAKPTGWVEIEEDSATYKEVE